MYIRLIMFLGTCLIPFLSFSQIQESDSVYQIVEKMPAFPGGDEGFYKYIANNFRYPTAAREKGEQGEVQVQFIVTKGGTIEDIRIVKSVSEELDNEAKRLVLSMPKWNAGLNHEGKKVSVRTIKSIKFKLQ